MAEGSEHIGEDETTQQPEETTQARKTASHPALKHWARYYLGAAILLGVLALFSRFAGSCPTVLVGLLWVVLSVFSMVGVAYHYLMRKIRRQVELNPNGILSKFNGGRTFCLVASFVISALCVGGLLFEMPTWGAAEWAMVVVGAVLFPVIVLAASKIIKREYVSVFGASRAVKWGSFFLAVLFVLFYIFVCRALSPVPDFADVTEAFLWVGQPYESSPSALMSQLGLYAAVSDGLTAYAISSAAQLSGVSGLVWVIQVILTAGTFSGLANLLGTCSLSFSELRRVFLPLPTVVVTDGLLKADPQAGFHPVWKFVIIAAVLPVLVLVLFLVGDHLVAQAMQTQEYTKAQQFVRDQVGVAVYVLDGKYYDQKGVEDLAASTRDRWAALSDDAQATIVPLINASFDQREANVDSYLDWYYSLPADYARLASLVTGSVDEYVEGQFEEKIEAGIDDTELESRYSDYAAQAASISSDWQEGLASYELDGLPSYLMVSNETLDAIDLDDPAKPATEAVEAAGRVGAGAGAGAGAGIAAKKLVTKAAEKKVFEKVVTKITEIIGTRAAGTAIGGGVGTIAGPAGTAIGAAAGTAIGFGVDYGLLKLDEAQNRDEYRQQIVDTIEEERSEWLAGVQGN